MSCTTCQFNSPGIIILGNDPISQFNLAVHPPNLKRPAQNSGGSTSNKSQKLSTNSSQGMYEIKFFELPALISCE